MKKELSDMTLNELWELFPIFLTEHKAYWRSWFEEEAERLQRILPIGSRISHIGSTAISSIWAKPIIDILVEIDTYISIKKVAKAIIQSGYILMSSDKAHFSFNKGYTADGFAERVFHLHLRYFGDNDELYFRDYLNEYPNIAHEYEQLKLTLWKQYEHNRDGYTERKTEFVKVNTKKAILLYCNRYRNS